MSCIGLHSSLKLTLGVVISKSECILLMCPRLHLELMKVIINSW